LHWRTSSWLAQRGLRWVLVSAAGMALLVLLADWVEAGARLAGGAQGGPTITEALLLALFLLPEHLVRSAPLIVALGSAIAVATLVRSGEWQALAGTGMSALRRLIPLAAVGLMMGGAAFLAQEHLVPRSASAYLERQAAYGGGPLSSGSTVWLSVGSTVFRISHIRNERLGETLAWTDEQGHLNARQRVEGLRWDGEAWQPEGEQKRLAWSVAPQTDPWRALPPPEVLAVRAGPDSAPTRDWDALGADDRPWARAERQARWSAALGCCPAAVAGGAVPALLGAGPITVVLAVVPVLLWELSGAVLQLFAAQGELPPPLVAWLRLALAALMGGALLRRLGRP